jgi:diguanylate cyclase (GGDEF)-like protein
MFVMVAILYLPLPLMASLLIGVVLVFSLLLPLFQPDPNQQFILINNLAIFAIGAGVIGLLINRDRAATFKAKQELEELLKHDLMTQLYNHDTILDLIEREVAAAKADHQPLSMLMLDLDDFKAINDRHGHLKGDEVLLQVVEVLRKNTRVTDLIGRYGGEEFMIVFTRTELPVAQKISERIRSAIEAVNITGITVTVSGGLSQWSDESAEAFIKMVDDRLYEAKRTGKNRIITA